MAQRYSAVHSVRLDLDLWDEIDAIAARSDFSRNSIIRTAIENHIDLIKIVEQNHQNRKQYFDGFDAA